MRVKIFETSNIMVYTVDERRKERYNIVKKCDFEHAIKYNISDILPHGRRPHRKENGLIPRNSPHHIGERANEKALYDQKTI